MRALQTTLKVYEDAKFHKKNVFALYTDYSNAFNTIDQERLLQVLRDLCFPDVTIEAVQDIYSEASTKIKTPAGLTSSIPAQRGVVQGDTLSPFLFNCFLEPLARWLQSGGRGYAYGCLEANKASRRDQMKCRTPCSSYADDSQLFCNTIPDLQLQADKVHRYSKRGNLIIQKAKCAITGMPHADINSGLTVSPKSWMGCQQLKKRLGCIRIGPHHNPFAHPDNNPQKVLGVLITPTLNWRHQQRTLLAAAKERGAAIIESDASSKQKLAMIQTTLKPFITYSFPLGVQTPGDISDLDGVVAATAKRALKLPMSTPTGLVLEGSACGAGAESLMIDYVQLGAAYLIRALNDGGKLGTVTKAMLKAQASRLGRVRSTEVGAHQGSYRLMRQLEVIKSAGVQVNTPRSLSKEDDPYTRLISRKDNDDPLQCLDIASLMSHIKLDPKLMGEKKKVPLSIMHDLAELGIQRLEDILCRSRKAIPILIDTTELERRFGRKVSKRHKLALNRLTMLAHTGPVRSEAPHHPDGCGSLPIEMRQVDLGLLEADFQRHKQPAMDNYVGTLKPDTSQTATQLISSALRKAFEQLAPVAPVTTIQIDVSCCGRKSAAKKRKECSMEYSPLNILQPPMQHSSVTKRPKEQKHATAPPRQSQRPMRHAPR